MKHIRIFGKTWKIVHKPAKEFDDEDYGLCKEETLTICIEEGLPADMERDVLWHEIKHAIAKQLNTKLTENQINIMAMAELAVLRDNKWLAPYLTDGSA